MQDTLLLYNPKECRERRKSLSFLPPWEFQTPLSLGTPRLLINLPKKWLSHDLMNMSLSKLWELVMDREAWRAAIHGVTKSRTRLSDWTEQVHEKVFSISSGKYKSKPQWEAQYLWQMGISRIFLGQESNSCLLHWQEDSLLLSNVGSPIQCFHCR